MRGKGCDVTVRQVGVGDVALLAFFAAVTAQLQARVATEQADERREDG